MNNAIYIPWYNILFFLKLIVASLFAFILFLVFYIPINSSLNLPKRSSHAVNPVFFLFFSFRNIPPEPSFLLFHLQSGLVACLASRTDVILALRFTIVLGILFPFLLDFSVFWILGLHLLLFTSVLLECLLASSFIYFLVLKEHFLQQLLGKVNVLRTSLLKMFLSELLTYSHMLNKDLINCELMNERINE